MARDVHQLLGGRLFAGLNDVDASTALRRFDEVEFPPGGVVLQQGHPATGLLCMRSGTVEIRAGDEVVGTATAGDLVGEMALFEDARRTASVVATEPTQLLVLERSRYEELRDTVHPIVANIENAALGVLIDRLRSVGDRISLQAEGSDAPLGSGISQFLANVAAQFGRGGKFGAEEVDAVGALDQSGLFSDVVDVVKQQVASFFRTTACAPGHVLCEEGRPGDRMFLLESGEVDVVMAVAHEGRVHHLATLEAGSFFGTVSLVQERPRMASCIARTRVVVLTLDRPGWEALVADQSMAGSAFRRALIRGMTEQLTLANGQLASFLRGARDEDLLRAGASMDTRAAPAE